MSEVALFATGSVIFLFTSWVTMKFLTLRFNELRGGFEPSADPDGRAASPRDTALSETDNGPG